ncbi:Transposon Tf2-8 polyprotein [Labeo rohita]|uniref:Transposon Tf2-8 polyprotein n=1 Tax=Labeo rohita TaxID=84645 RepID=A0ABQ8L0K4_LABRO|nr:Transposon Tf2-8 polyprotein [Labeo rohita]
MSGKLSLSYSVFLLTSPSVTIHRLMARQRGRSRSWDVNGHTVRGPAQLEQVPPVDRVRTELSPPKYHRLNTFPVPVDHWFRESERVWDSAHHHLQQAVRQHTRFTDARRRHAPAYQPGDQVWLSTHDLRLRLPCRKLSPRYIGPFKILRQINNVTFQLHLPPRYRIHPTFHVSLLKPFFPSATDHTGAEAEPPPPEVLDQPSVFTVLDSQCRGGHLEYFVDWEGVTRITLVVVVVVVDHGLHRVSVSEATPGGGGSVRHSPQPPPSATPPVAPATHSSSPKF